MKSPGCLKVETQEDTVSNEHVAGDGRMVTEWLNDKKDASLRLANTTRLMQPSTIYDRVD